MSSSAEEKRLLEKQATDVFILLYERQFSQSLEFVRQNTPAKPDVTCKQQGSQLDIEIAHLYGSQQEAMQILGKSLSQQTLEELTHLTTQSDTDERLHQALNTIIKNKAQKTYDSRRVWLVIRNTHPQWRLASAKSLRAVTSLKHPFEQIWLIRDFDGEDGLVKLFPI